MKERKKKKRCRIGARVSSNWVGSGVTWQAYPDREAGVHRKKNRKLMHASHGRTP